MNRYRRTLKGQDNILTYKDQLRGPPKLLKENEIDGGCTM